MPEWLGEGRLEAWEPVIQLEQYQGFSLQFAVVLIPVSALLVEEFLTPITRQLLIFWISSRGFYLLLAETTGEHA